MSNSSTIPVDDVLDVIRQHVKDTATVHAIAKDILAAQKEIAAEKAADKEKGVKTKNRFVVLIRSDDGAKLKPLVGGGAYVMTVPDDSTSNTYMGEGLLARISSAARTFNDSLKRKKGNRAIKTFVQAMESLKSKAVKASGSSFLVKTKYPAEVVVVDKEDIL